MKDIFLFSAYPASEELRLLSNKPKLLFTLSWLTILIEILFPLSLLNHIILYFALTAVFSFHLGNTLLFGFNRFLWIWLAAYPSILWFQAYLNKLIN